MVSVIEQKGKCLCGRVEIHATAMSTDVGVCHCSMCRKWGGGPLFAVDCNTEIQIDGAEFVSAYASSAWAERGFCSNCGTHLYYKLKPGGQYIVPAGIFDGAPALSFDHQIFIEEKPAYYAFSNQTKNMTGEEVFAQFSGDSSAD